MTAEPVETVTSYATHSHDTVKSYVDFITQIQFKVHQTSQINSHPEKVQHSGLKARDLQSQNIEKPG